MSIEIINKRSLILVNVIFAVVLILGIVASSFVYIRGESISSDTSDLIEQDVPNYDLLRKLNNNITELERFLYEFYATENEEDFEQGFVKSTNQAHAALDELIMRFGEIRPLQITRTSLSELNEMADEFMLNIADPQTDWTLARAQLRAITDLRRATTPQIQQLIKLTSDRVEESEKAILSGLEKVRFFVILYGITTLLIAYAVARGARAYLATSANNERLSLFPTRNPNPVISLDYENNVTFQNPASDQLLIRIGVSDGNAKQLLARDLNIFQAKILADGNVNSMTFEYQVAEFYFQCDLHWLEDQRQWDLHLNDITERKQVENELEYRASHNPETGLKNRYELEKIITDMCSNNVEHAFGIIEIRSYSQLLSGRGMAVASTVVKEIAASIQNIISTLGTKDCQAFHIGEKGFAFFSSYFLSKEQIENLVEQIEQKIAATIFHCQYQVQLDFGFACFPQHGEDYTQLHKNALAALDKSASSDDKTYVVFNPELGAKLQYEQRLVDDMRQAIELSQFELYFQPQLSLHTQEVVGAEVLIRWQRDGEWISPGEFIPLAESSGLIVSLGDWILQTACEKTRGLVDLGFDDLVVAVNISPLQFSRKDFLPKMTNVLHNTKLPAKNLELEITEGVIIYNEQETIETLEELKNIGVKLAIDDFGTGYSSLSYLKKFNIDKLKIDQSFVRHIQSETADQSIVRTIIDLGRNLELKLIAEGVEEHEQQEILRSMGCDEIQGYYFSRPLPEQDFIKFVKAHKA